jgi:5S rRNA maturation endonuclease (ribonuclease M5)
MSSLERKLEKLNLLIERLRNEASAGALLIVEGEKDIESLKAIGVEDNNIIAFKSLRKNFYDLVDEISSANREVILLMDFDRRGRELMERLAKILEEIGVKVNAFFWRNFHDLLNADVKDVEGLATYLGNLRRKVGKQFSYSICKISD